MMEQHNSEQRDTAEPATEANTANTAHPGKPCEWQELDKVSLVNTDNCYFQINLYTCRYDECDSKYLNFTYDDGIYTSEGIEAALYRAYESFYDTEHLELPTINGIADNMSEARRAQPHRDVLDAARLGREDAVANRAKRPRHEIFQRAENVLPSPDETPHKSLDTKQETSGSDISSNPPARGAESYTRRGETRNARN